MCCQTRGCRDMQGPELAQVKVMEGEAMEYKKEEVVGFMPG